MQAVRKAARVAFARAPRSSQPRLRGMAAAAAPPPLPASAQIQAYVSANKLRLLTGGGFLGASAVVGGVLLFFQGNPEKAESTVATIAMSSFTRSPTFKLKKAIYVRMKFFF